MRGSEVLIPITLFLAIAFVVFYYLRYRFQERQAIIEKGLSGEDLKILLGSRPRRETDGSASAKYGILAICLGLAILIGNQFSEETVWGLVFLFPGIGLLVYHRFFMRKQAVDQ
jgi:hypothetical protein